MLFHGEKCRHCRGNMTEPKLIPDGPRKGGYRTICVSCGHIEYQNAPQTQAQPNPVPAPAPMPGMPAQARPQQPSQPGQPRKPVIFTG